MLFHRMQRQPSTKTASGQRPVSAVQLPAESNEATIIQIRLLLLPLR